MLERACAPFPNVRVDGFSGLLTTSASEHDIHAIVKGLRAVSDFDYELQMAQMNARLTDVETVFLPTSPECRSWPRAWSRRSPRFGGDVSGLLPDFVLARLTARLAERVSGRAAAEATGRSPAPGRFGRAGAGPIRFSLI